MSKNTSFGKITHFNFPYFSYDIVELGGGDVSKVNPDLPSILIENLDEDNGGLEEILGNKAKFDPGYECEIEYQWGSKEDVKILSAHNEVYFDELNSVFGMANSDPEPIIRFVQERYPEIDEGYLHGITSFSKAFEELLDTDDKVEEYFKWADEMGIEYIDEFRDNEYALEEMTTIKGKIAARIYCTIDDNKYYCAIINFDYEAPYGDRFKIAKLNLKQNWKEINKDKMPNGSILEDW